MKSWIASSHSMMGWSSIHTEMGFPWNGMDEAPGSCDFFRLQQEIHPLIYCNDWTTFICIDCIDGYITKESSVGLQFQSPRKLLLLAIHVQNSLNGTKYRSPR